MPPKIIVKTKAKASSAKKKKAQEPPNNSGDTPQQPPQAPSGRQTINSLSAAGLFPPPSRSPTPLVTRTIRFEGVAHSAKETPYPGGTGRPLGRNQHGVGFHGANENFLMPLDRTAFRICAKKYLRRSTRKDIRFDDVMAIAQVPQSPLFSKPTMVHSDDDFKMLNAALEARSEAVLNVHLEWTVPVDDDDSPSQASQVAPSPSLSLGGPTTSSSASIASKRKRASAVSAGSSGSSLDRISLDESMRLSREIAAKLHKDWPLCGPCTRERALTTGVCWYDANHDHHHLSQHAVVKWANAIRDGLGQATLEVPPDWMADKLLDKHSPPRGIHAARAAGRPTASSSTAGSSSSSSLGATSSAAAAATTPSRHVDTIDLTGLSSPPRTPFTNITNSFAAQGLASLPRAGHHWPLKEWVKRGGDHHGAIVDKLFDVGLVTMAMVSRSQQDGSLQDLELTNIQRSIIAHWVDEWKSFDSSYEACQERKALAAASPSVGGAGSSTA